MSDAKRKVLLVDDDPGTVMAVGRRLEVAGFEVVVAMDGEDALAKVRAAHPDIIVLDLQLPKLSGLKVCTTLKRDQLSQHIPIIVLTGKDDVVDEQACRECGADAYLTKTSNATDLITQIHALLGQA